MISIGFTGTRKGMTPAQHETVIGLLDWLKADEVHHGDCIGADKQFHTIALSKGLDIIGHPASDVGSSRAYCQGFFDMWSEKPPLERNKDIVSESDIMIAAPKEFHEIRRSGTWATIRYAKSQGVKTYIVFPDGSIEN